MDVIWTAQRPKVCGLHWRRNSDQGVPYLTIVFEGPNGLEGTDRRTTDKLGSEWVRERPN